ncbi:immunoglobulin-like domain-containing protein [Breznakia pachnodae]|uniref:Ribosomal protein L21 n=1 Tax=Breznakia pachnodae TaxID=265178 RepID=A0ABU0DZ55_9FIRM|nr:immunoglobulin-like domain-containing protein [Breznakia pachnodae]MDQ0359768.1 ribosomal protein L21 [Breznakia pachnodae]
MKRKLNVFWKVTLAFTLSITCIGTFLQASNILANEEFEVKESVTYNEEKTEAVISFDIENINEKYTILDIVDPQGISLGLEGTYTVNENETYKFNIVYSEGDEEYTYEKEVIVDGFDSDESNNSQSQSDKTLTETMQSERIFARTAETNLGVTVDIPAYDGIGWANGNIKDVSVRVDFGDASSANKKLSITVPEGMRYEMISVIDGVTTTNVDTTLLAQYGSGDPLGNSITTMKLPTKDAIGATSGNIEYTFAPGAEVVVIKFKVSVDMARYYGPHTIPNPIRAVATKNASNDVVGDASITVEGSGSAIATLNWATHLPTGTTNIVASETDYDSKGNTTAMRSGGMENQNTKIKYYYAKKAEVELYYPDGTEYVSVSPASGYTINHDSTARKVTMTSTGWMSNATYYVNYKVPESLGVGNYVNGGLEKITLTWYDGTTTVKTRTGSPYSVNVVTAADQKMSIPSSYNTTYDSSVTNHFMYGPTFQVKNTTAGVKKDQVAEFQIDENYKVTRIVFPFDTSISSNQITEIEYMLPGDTTYRTYTYATPLKPTTEKVAITNTSIGLSSTDYFIAMRVKVGNFRQGFSSGDYLATSGHVAAWGILDDGTNATVTFSMYQDGDELATRVSRSGTISSTQSNNRKVASMSTTTYKKDGATTNAIVAGETVQMSTLLNIATHEPLYETVHAIENPQIYLRQPEGMKISESSIKIVDNQGNEVAKVITSYDRPNGEKIFVIQTQGATIGRYFGSSLSSTTLTVSYDVVTEQKLVGEYNAQDMIAWGDPNTTAVSTYPLKAYTDIYDMDNDGSTSDTLLGVYNNIIKVSENKNVLVDTYLNLEGEEPKDPYVEGDINTLAYFTPGTDADYTVKVTNNGDVPADTFVVYIPIPKAGANFGESFQSEAFKWNTKLKSTLAPISGFDISYTSTATETNYKEDSIYSTTVSDLSKVNMIRISSNTPIPSGDGATFKIPLNVDETFDTATSGNKIGTRNIFNPSYDVISTDFKGTLSGTKVGTELVIAEVGGTVFIDNNGDGLYKTEDGDAPVDNHEIRLWKLNETTNVYEKVMKDGNQVSVATDASGVYLFDYTTGMGYGTYAVEFVEKTGSTYQYTVNNPVDTTIDSDAIVANDIPNLGDTYRGWVLGIDATKPVAKTIGCGFLEYNPPVDLKLTVPSDTQVVKVGENINITPTKIEPDFWESIKNPTTAYTWELVNASDSAYITLAGTSTKTVNVTGVSKTTGTQTVEIRLTIKDIYGQKKSEVVEVKVNTSTAPTVTLPTINAYKGDVINWLGTEVTAIDDNGDTIILEPSDPGKNVEWDTSTVPMTLGTLSTEGTYNVEYRITDTYGNTKTQNRVVKVNGLPSITTSVQTYALGDATIDTQIKSSSVVSASYLKASDTVGTAPADTAITGITYSIKSGPSTTDFSKVGTYKIEYSVTNPDSKVATKETTVLITDENTKVENDLAIRADNIVLTQDEAKAFTKANAITKADVKAYEYTRTDGNITGVDTLTNITSADVSAITGVSAKGGEFKLVFTATGVSGTITKEILVVVEGTEIQEDNGIVVKAKGFTIANTDAIGLTDAIAQSSGRGNVSAYLLKDETPVTTIEASTTELAAINAVGLAGATKDLTFTAKDSGKTSTITVSVVVSPTLTGPTITANDCEHYVGDAFDVLHDVTAEDATSTAITLKTEDPNKNTVVTHSIPNGSDKYTTAGTYEVSIKVTDQFGNESTETRKVKVNGLPEITVPVQTYYLSDTTIATQVDGAASASYLKADDTVGVAPTATEVTGISNTIKSGPSTDYSKVGAYVVEYTVTNTDGKTAIKEVNVLILDDTTKVENDLAIRADNIVLTQDEAKAFTKVDAITKADVKAYEYTRTDGNITGVDTLTNITSADVSDIKNVSTKGGEFRLTFTATGTSGSITKEILVVVEGTEIQENDGIVVKAKGFTIANTDAATLDDSTSQGNGSVSAYLLKDETPIIDIEADTTDLTDINAVGLEGDTKPLTFTAEDNGKTSAITVDVTISATLIKPTITADDCEHYVGDSFDVLHGVSAEDATNTNIPLLTTRALTNTVVTHNIPVTDGKYTTPGTYEVTYEITDRFGNTQTKTRTVKVHGLVEIEASAQEYLSDDATILSQVESAASASYLKASDGVGSAPVSIDLSSDIKVTVESGPDGTTDFSKVGIYKVTYRVTNTDGKTDSVTIDVLIEDSGTIVDATGTLKISGVGFQLTQDDAKKLTEKEAIKNGDVKAFEIIKDVDGTTIGYNDVSDSAKVYTEQLTAINNVTKSGGIFDLIFEVEKDGKSVSKLVKVSVQGTGTPPIVVTPDGDELAISANDFTITYKEALIIDETTATDLSEVEAYLLKTDPDLVNASTDSITIKVSGNQLDMIRGVTSKGGTYDLTFTAEYISKDGQLVTNTVTIKVTVLPEGKASTAPTESTTTNNSVGTSDSTNMLYYILLLGISSMPIMIRRKYRR